MSRDHNNHFIILHNRCIQVVAQSIGLRIQKSRQLSASVQPIPENNGGKKGKYLIIFDQLLSVVEELTTYLRR